MPKYVINRLQVVQNAAARTLLQIPRHKSTRAALKTLHWLPVQARIKFKAICNTHRAMNDRGPALIKKLVTHYIPSRNLRSSADLLMQQSRIKRARWGGRSFKHLVPKIWNTLPRDTHMITNKLEFRKRLKTWLFP